MNYIQNVKVENHGMRRQNLIIISMIGVLTGVMYCWVYFGISQKEMC